MLVELNKKFPQLRKKILNPFLINCNPNIVSLLALLMAILSGYLFYANQVILASFLLLLNGFLDILDGEIAKKFNRKTKLGDFLDHTLDRISDIIIFFGVAMNPGIPYMLGFLTLIFVFLVSYMGTQFQAITNKRLYSGIFGRSDRILFLFLFGIGTIIFENSLYYGVIFTLILSIVTLFQRFFVSVKKIGGLE